VTRKFVYLEDNDIVLLRTSGTYDLEKEVGTLKKMVSKLKEHKCNRCIYDHRETNVIIKTLDSYERPAIYEDLWGDHTIRAATVLRELNNDSQFLEIVCQNHCWNVRIFDDYDTAIDWLSD